MKITAIITICSAMFLVCLSADPEPVPAGRSSLTPRQRCMIPVATFTAVGNMDALKGAIHNGLDAGLTVNEVKEMLVHAYAYAGFPRSLNAINMCIAVLEESRAQGIDDSIGRSASPMPAGFDRNVFGHQTRNRLVGRDMSQRTSGYATFAPIIDDFLVEHLFADIFSRDVLTHQDRELLTISMLAAMSGTDGQLKSHLRIAEKEGFSHSQFKEFAEVITASVGDESGARTQRLLTEVMGIPFPEADRSALKVFRKTAAAEASGRHFSGSVRVESWFAAESHDSYRGAMVHFEAGARTAWHSHPRGQTLIVTAGRGRVQSSGEAVQEISPGDVVWIPANVRHWHGASPDSAMSHLAISTPENGLTVEWMELVDDAEYHANPSSEIGE